MLRKDRGVGNVPRNARTLRFPSRLRLFGLQKRVRRQQRITRRLKSTDLIHRHQQMATKDGASGHHVTLTGGIVRDLAGAAVALEGTFIGILKVLCFSA